MTTQFSSWRAAGLTCGVMLLMFGTWAEAQQPQFRRLRSPLPEGAALIRQVQAGPADMVERRVSDFWLGLECYPADAALRAQLGLEKLGLVVEHVMPESPGDKAGIKQHDVLIKAGDKGLSRVPDLVDAIDEAKESELAIELVRGGKSITVEVTPARRPNDQNVVRRAPEGELGELRRWIESLRPGERQTGPLRYRVFGPGAVLPPVSGQKLPEGLTISVTRTGAEPAQIVVKKGDQKWAVSEEELNDLPEDIRPHVERMLGRNVAFFLPRPDLLEPGPPPGAFGPRRGERDSDADGIEKRMDQQMKQLNEQFERLREQFEDLRRSLPNQEQPRPKDRA